MLRMASRTRSSPRHTALVITHDLTLVHDMTVMLRQIASPIDVVHAPSFDSALDALPSVVLVDAEARPATLARAQERFPATPLVAIVGLWSETEAEVQGFADGLIHKPLRLPEIVAFSRQLLSAPNRLTA